jgi:hypothetical protein
MGPTNEKDAIKTNSGISFIFISKLILLVILVISFAYTLYLSANDPNAIYSTTYTYLIGSLTIILVMFALVFSFNDELNATYLFVPIVSVSMILISIYLYFNTNVLSYIFSGYLLSTFIIVFFIVALGILYKLLSVQSFEGGWGGFVFNLIFYIPCLLVNFVEFLLNDYYSTPKTVFVLFLIEIAVILCYLYAIPAIFNYISRDSVNILTGPIFLDDYNKIDAGTVQKITKIEGSDIRGIAPYQFTISMWVYLNPPNLSTIPNGTESNIFYYGKDEPNKKDGHPQLSYYIDKNNAYYKIRVGSNNSNDANSYKFEAPYQKWNNFVFSYVNNTMDVFVNGNLVKTFSQFYLEKTNGDVMTFGTDITSTYTLKENDSELKSVIKSANAKSESKDISKSGFTNNGLYGAICNVVYYKKPLDNGQIITNYNMLSVNIPPIFGNMSLSSWIVL